MAAMQAQAACERRAGANAQKKKKGRGGRSVSPFENKPPNLLGPEAVREKAKSDDLTMTDLKTKDDWERAKLELILDKLASST
eukprot:8094126-Pyramimonas_sp.AAC.1